MTSTTIEERIRLRMRGGPPWGFRVEGSTTGPVYISSVSRVFSLIYFSPNVSLQFMSRTCGGHMKISYMDGKLHASNF